MVSAEVMEVMGDRLGWWFVPVYSVYAGEFELVGEGEFEKGLPGLVSEGELIVGDHRAQA